jgi:acetate kinase
MSDTILVINAGSSSIKFQLFAVASDKLDGRLRGQFEGIGSRPHLLARDAEDKVLVDEVWSPNRVPDLPTAIERLQAWIKESRDGAPPAAIGHRVVHGGPAYDRPVRVTHEVIRILTGFTSLAPLHQPNNLAPIETIHQRRPDVLQVACFDTAFHRQHGELADRFAIPEKLYQDGVRRYGFHGLSYEYIAQILPSLAPSVADGRVIVAHLGSGASMCALRSRNSVDSTMGFTALDGLPMGTRPGQLDPGVVLYLHQRGMSTEAVQSLLYKECGLKGLSGISQRCSRPVGERGPTSKGRQPRSRPGDRRSIGFIGSLVKPDLLPSVRVLPPSASATFSASSCKVRFAIHLLPMGSSAG